MSTNKKAMVPWLLLAALVAAAGMALLVQRGTPSDDASDSGPFQYDLSDLRSAQASENVVCRELSNIETGLQQIDSIDVNGQRLVLVGGDVLTAVDDRGTELMRVSLAEPAHTVLAHEDRVLVGFADHVETFAQDGVLQSRWADLGQNAYVTDLAVTGPHVLVGDAGSKVVWIFDLEGALRGRVGEKDAGRGIPGFLIRSMALAVVPDGPATFWAVNSGRQSVQRYTIKGDLLEQWGRASMEPDGFCGCCNPVHLARLPDGWFVTSEKGLVRIKLYRPDGTYAGLVTPVADYENTSIAPDIATDERGKIYVAEPRGGRVRVFTRRSDTADLEQTVNE